MREHRAAANVTRGPDSACARGEPLVDLDDALLRQRNAYAVETEIVGVRLAPDCQEHVRRLDLPSMTLRVERRAYAARRLLEPRRAVTEDELDAFALEHTLQRVGDVAIL